MNKINLSDRNWKSFNLGDTKYFKIYSGIRLTKKDMIPGNRPFIGATDKNNGITSWVANENQSLDKNVLGVNYNGSVVENFYHPYEAIFSDDVKRIKLQFENANKMHYLFLKTIILQQKQKYAYGYKFNENRMKSQKIMLPIDSNGNPDYQFMEDYMESLEESLNIPKKFYIQNKINQNTNFNVKENKQWNAFRLIDIFEEIRSSESSIDYNSLTEDKRKGNIPYITRTNLNNGMGKQIDTLDNHFITENGNCISIGLDTQTVFYQPFSFYSGQNIQILYTKQLNKYNAMFLITMLKNVLSIFNWGGNGATLTRLKHSKIMLPIDENNNPDWQYMEDYIKSLPNADLL